MFKAQSRRPKDAVCATSLGVRDSGVQGLASGSKKACRSHADPSPKPLSGTAAATSSKNVTKHADFYVTRCR
jgi:hypothetical protein